MKQAKMQWLQNPNQSNVDNPNNVKRAASRHFRGGKKRRNIGKLKLMKLKQTVRTRISETCIGESMTLRRITSLELM
jgi:hypothetical protein